ncbi:MAG: YaaR family protein [Firmicutes bacterium]|nr:YaaR family protein [Bacillota bacterium]
MKVRDALNQMPGVPGKLEKDEKKATVKQSMFGTQLRKTGGKHYEERLYALLDGINKQGERLGVNIDIKELQVYKKLISEFLYEATSNSHRFHKESLLDRRGRHRVFATIKKVNENLEDLTQEVLKEEKDNIKVLQKLDDIRGLLLDIVI